MTDIPLPSRTDKPALDCSVVIATRHRSQPLSDTLDSIASLAHRPLEIIIVDSSADSHTRDVCAAAKTALPIHYQHTTDASAARQRNLGITIARGEFVVFLDDDVVLDREFLFHLLEPFSASDGAAVGGVGGTIVNELLPAYSRFNRALLSFFIGTPLDDVGGRVLGPAVHFAYGDIGTSTRRVECLSSCACAYRRAILEQYRFAPSFVGYSFMEDVHLSHRIGKRYRLLQAGAAHLTHLGLGTKDRKDWPAHGESRLINRHYVMTDAMGKNGISDHIRLLGFELVYTTIAGIWNGGRGGATGSTLQQLAGKLRGMVRLLMGRSPHAPSPRPDAPAVQPAPGREGLG